MAENQFQAIDDYVSTLGHDEAAGILEGFHGTLRQGESTLPGVLTLQWGKDGTPMLGTARWWQSRDSAAEASYFVQQLVKKAYSDQAPSVEKPIGDYLKTTSAKFGTLSFVKMVEGLTNKQDLVPEHADLEEGGRLNLEGILWKEPTHVDSVTGPTREFFNALQDKLSDEAKAYYGDGGLLGQALLASNMKLSSDSKPMFVLGDDDGDMTRQLLAAIATGHCVLPKEAIDDLAGMLDTMAKAATLNPSDWAKIQKDEREKPDKPTMQERLTQLLGQAQFQKSEIPLVFIGDCFFDRLLVAPRETAQLMKKLHDAGVTFIRGNHDDPQIYEHFKDGFHKLDEVAKQASNNLQQYGQFGIYALAKLTDAERTEITSTLKDLYCNCKVINGVIFTHNGFNKGQSYDDSGGDSYETAFGRTPISAATPQEFEEKLNARPLPDRKKNLSDFFRVTDFRPKGTSMSKKKIGVLATAKGYCGVCHGHDDDYGARRPGVLAVNARSPKKKNRLAPCFFMMKPR
jgi:hypothetical protein